jgi:hypothetical protein
VAVVVPSELRIPCTECKGQGTHTYPLPRGWQTVRDLLTTANEVRQANSLARTIPERRLLEQAWADMRAAWLLAKRIGLKQPVGAEWCEMAKSGFNNVVCGRVGDRRTTPQVVEPEVELVGEPSETTIECPRCHGHGYTDVELTPAQVDVVQQLHELGRQKYARADLDQKYTAIQRAAYAGASLGLSQVTMAHALRMSRAGLIGILNQAVHS